jgi:hypothetical protein
VFRRNSILFSQTIPSCLRSDEYPPEPWPGGPAWKPLTGVDYTSSNLRFDARNEQVMFKTSSGDFLFSANDGTLLKITSH